MNLLNLAVRNVLRHGWRTSLTLAAIAIGVAGLILAGGFIEDVYVQLGEATIHSQLGHIQIYRQGYYQNGSRKPFEFALEKPAEVVKTVSAISGVREVMLRLNFSALLNNGRADLAVIGEGLQPDKEAFLGTYITILRGRELTVHDAFGIMIGEGVAKVLNLAPGDRTTLVANTADGALNSLDFQVVGIFRSFSKDYDNRAVRIPLDAARTLLNAEIANAAVVLLEATSQTDATRQAIEQRLTGRNVEVMTWRQLSDFYEKTIALYKRQFGVLQFITLVLVILGVMNSVSMTAFERAGEFGTMRALGNRTRMIFQLIVLENAFLGVVGSIVGLIIALLAAAVISVVGIPMPPPPNAESGYTAAIRIVSSTIAIAMAAGVTAAVVAALLPARRVAKMPVVEALRQNV